jgi:hypothetical protein
MEDVLQAVGLAVIGFGLIFGLMSVTSLENSLTLTDQENTMRQFVIFQQTESSR